jgi:thioredoxin-dependent peroxiredoxin
MIETGQEAPDFTLKDQNGEHHSLKDYRGKNVVLYFYPKDMSSGCSVEAKSFRDDLEKFEKKNAVILGVSADDVESHKQFETKERLNFPLLSDEEKKVVQDYGVYVNKNPESEGESSMGIRRTTFLIDEYGMVSKIFPDVDVNIHSKELLAEL